MSDSSLQPSGDRQRGTCIIMAGGRGTRFWPLSRSDHPKQLLPLGTTTSLLRDTWERVLPVFGPDRILVITNCEQAEGIAAELPELAAERIVAEPIGRNTAACCVLGATLAERLHGDEPVAFLPADHVITDVDIFRSQLRQAVTLAAGGEQVVTFGIAPTRPASEYGYMQVGDEVSQDLSHGLRFVEKPNPDTARTYLATGDYFWNSGMFVWPHRSFAAAASRLVPDVISALTPAAAVWGTDSFPAALTAAYAACPEISIDVGIMERLDGFLILKAGFSWTDLGSWDAWGDLASALAGGNKGLGALLAIDSERNTVYSPDRFVALLGVDDLVVVDTPQAILVTRREDVQRLREVTAELENLGREDLI